MQPRVLVLSAALFSSSLFAQNAALSGTVTDPAKARVPGAVVSAMRIDTRTAQSTTTNPSGIYQFSDLAPGGYEIQVKAQGFQTFIQQDLELHVGDRVTLDLELRVGATTETVSVSGASDLVNTSDASVGTVVGHDFIANMPLNGRSFQSLITLTPGVVVAAAASGAPGQFSINGQRTDANYFTVDGVSANVGVASGGSTLAGSAGSGIQPSSGGGFNNLVSLDAMQEFKVQTSTFAPEYGRTPGGQITIVTRSGTNQFHGDAFDYFRNNDLDANDWFLNARGAAHPPERQNDFGGVVGGPIKKDKLFFFGSYEGLRLTVPAQVNQYVPSLCARGEAACPTGSSPAPAAIIPYINAFPQPTAGGCSGVLANSADPYLAPFCQGYPGHNTLNASSLRVDYNITSKLTLFGRVNYAPSSSTSRGTFTSLMTAQYNLTSETLGATYIVNPQMVNDFHFNYTFVTGYANSAVDSFGGAVPVPAAQLFPSSISVPGADPISISNSRILFILTPGTEWRTGLETKNEARQYNYVDALNWTKGSHRMKLGVDFRRLTPVQARAFYQQNYTFATTASLLKGIPDTYSPATNANWVAAYHNLSLYWQDAWKATSSLTVTYGLRWDFNPAPGNLSGVPFLALNQLDQNNLGATVIAPIGTPVYHNQYNAFAPRIGIAYQISKRPAWGTVLRAGFGVFYDTTGDTVCCLATTSGGTATYAAGGQYPQLTQFPATIAQATPPSPSNVAPFPVEVVSDPHLRLPYVYQMNVALEQSLGARQSVTVTYAGALGRNQFLTYAYPALSNTASGANLPQGYEAFANAGKSSYHSLQSLFNRRLSAGIQVMASYVWAHSIDTASLDTATIPNPSLIPTGGERGSSDFDIRHSFQTGLNYSMPKLHMGRVGNAILGHWGSDIIFRARTAPPINVIDGNAYFSQLYPTIKINTRPDLTGGPIYLYGSQCAAAYGSPCPGGWALNPDSKTSLAAGIPAAFIRPQATCPVTGVCLSPTQGGLGRNTLRGYGWNELDFTLRREFPITEKIKLQFRADFFNILNHPAFAFAPGATSLNVANAAFGRTNTMLDNALASSGGVPAFNPLYQIGGPRSVQLSLKLVF